MNPPRVSTVVARASRILGTHVYCGYAMMALPVEIRPGTPFQVCTYCDNIPAGKPPFDQGKE